jgi:hypothetical protein
VELEFLSVIAVFLQCLTFISVDKCEDLWSQIMVVEKVLVYAYAASPACLFRCDVLTFVRVTGVLFCLTAETVAANSSLDLFN